MIDKEIEFKPFLSEEVIKLSPGIIIGYLAKPTKSGKVCDMAQAVRFMMLCKARGLNPWEGDAYLVGYDSKDGPEFNLITAHQAFLKRAEVHPEYEGMESGVVVRTPDKELHDVEGDYVDDGLALCGGWARVFKKGKRPTYKRLRLSTFNKGYSRWQVDAAGMIVKCAEADALRSAFPNSLGGMYLEQELAIGETSSAPAPLSPGKMDLRQPKQISANGNGAAHAPPPQDIVIEHEPQTSAPEPEAAPPPEIDNHADGDPAAERFDRATAARVAINLANRSWEMDLAKRHGGRKWPELTPDEQEAEVSRLVGLKPVGV